MKIMVTFAEGNQSRHPVITWRIAVIKRLITQPVCKTVYAEGSLLDHKDTQDAGVDKASEEVTP